MRRLSMKGITSAHLAHSRVHATLLQLAGMQVDNVRGDIGLHALHSFSVLSEILHDDPRRIVSRIGRRTALVREMHLSDRGGGGLLERLGHRRGCARHEVLRSLLHVLSNGAGVGQSYIVGRWVTVGCNCPRQFIFQRLNVSERRVFAHHLSVCLSHGRAFRIVEC